MKKTAMALFAMGILFTGYACDIEEDSPPDAGLQESVQPDVTQEARYSYENCKAPNEVFGTKCCSVEGEWGGLCKFDRDWISGSGCQNEYVKDGIQYCCGGDFVSHMGAYGFQCVRE